MTTRRVDVDPNFQRQVQACRTSAAQEAETRQTGNASQTMAPVNNDWSGDLFDWDGIHQAFHRDRANSQMIEAMQDSRDSGVVGDLIAATMQIETLAVMERAYRARHTMRFPRAVAHALGRKYGHGHVQGAFSRGMLEYVRGLIKESSG